MIPPTSTQQKAAHTPRLSVQAGVLVNKIRKLERMERTWDGLLQVALERLPALSSGWDGTENQRAQRCPMCLRALHTRDSIRDQINEARDALRQATA